MSMDTTPKHIRLDERNHVEKPFLDQLAGLGWTVIDLTDEKQNPSDTFRESFTEVIMPGDLACEGYHAFYPRPLPPELTLDWELMQLLSDADQALGELSGAGQLLPNPHLPIRPYLRREAILSSRIEDTHAEMVQLALFEEEGEEAESRTPDVREVANYVRALEHGLARVNEAGVNSREPYSCSIRGSQQVRPPRSGTAQASNLEIEALPSRYAIRSQHKTGRAVGPGGQNQSKDGQRGRCPSRKKTSSAPTPSKPAPMPKQRKEFKTTSKKPCQGSMPLINFMRIKLLMTRNKRNTEHAR